MTSNYLFKKNTAHCRTPNFKKNRKRLCFTALIAGVLCLGVPPQLCSAKTSGMSIRQFHFMQFFQYAGSGCCGLRLRSGALHRQCRPSHPITHCIRHAACCIEIYFCETLRLFCKDTFALAHVHMFHAKLQKSFAKIRMPL